MLLIQVEQLRVFDWMLLLAVPSAQQRDLIVSFCFETETAIVFLITIPFYSK
jgi:hypothetical protein